MSRADPQCKVRLPVDLKEWVSRQAAKNYRSVNAEIVFALRERMQAAGTSPEKANPAAETHTAVSAAGSSTHG